MMVFSDGVSTGALSALPTDLQNALSGAGRVLPVGCVNGETGVLFDHFRSFARYFRGQYRLTKHSAQRTTHSAHTAQTLPHTTSAYQ